MMRVSYFFVILQPDFRIGITTLEIRYYYVNNYLSVTYIWSRQLPSFRSIVGHQPHAFRRQGMFFRLSVLRVWLQCRLPSSQEAPTREEVRTALEQVLAQRKANNEPLDDMTFAGNGEPTGHPDFRASSKDTIGCATSIFPRCRCRY